MLYNLEWIEIYVIYSLEAVVQKCSIEKVFLKSNKTHKKVPVSKSLF